MSKQLEMEQRIKEEADFMIKTNCTIRECAIHFKCSKTRIHLDLTKRLLDIDIKTYNKIRIILNNNLKNGRINGGNATRMKYKNIKIKRESKEYEM